MTIVYFIIALSGIIMVHEIGHFTAAKTFKVYCKEFSLGFGPTLLKYQGKETKYCLRALPLGGYVAMVGDEGNEIEGVPWERTIKGIAKYKRVIIMLAGIVLNLVVAWVLFVTIFLVDPRAMNVPPAIIESVVSDSPAEKAGIQAKDEIITITKNNEKYEITDYFVLSDVLSKCNQEIILTIIRQQEKIEISITPEFLKKENRYYIGILGPTPTFRQLSFGECITTGTKVMLSSIREMAVVIGGLLFGRGYDDLTGPIGIYQVVDEFSKQGFLSYLMIIAFLSLNVGFFNLLPLPILDGGRVILIILEAIIGKPLNQKFETALLMASLMLVGLLMFVAFYNDILKILMV